MKSLYPEIIPFNTFFLNTNSQHSVYVEQSGTVDGVPVIFLHGGPCSGTKPDHRRFFNPEQYHIILLDQRGSGQSLPFGDCVSNTTQDLIDDMERIRHQLGIHQWVLFGGSWGAALSLLYAQQYADKVLGMILRGTFLARAKDLDWFIKQGVARIYPEQWHKLAGTVAQNNRPDIVPALYEILLGNDELAKRRVTKAWMEWGSLVTLGADYQNDNSQAITDKMVKQVRMELHYAKHNYFIQENQIIDQCDLIKHIPTIIIHGQKDLVCPLEAGYTLAKALPQAEYIVLSNSGHIAQGEEMIDALVSASDKMLKIIEQTK